MQNILTGRLFLKDNYSKNWTITSGDSILSLIMH
jgi:hypothetical protein